MKRLLLLLSFSLIGSSASAINGLSDLSAASQKTGGITIQTTGYWSEYRITNRRTERHWWGYTCYITTYTRTYYQLNPATGAYYPVNSESYDEEQCVKSP